MKKYIESPIQYGVKLSFSDGTVINWYKDSKRKTVYAERNPGNYLFPRSAKTIQEILAGFSAEIKTPEGPPWIDGDGCPISAFDGGASPNPGLGGWGVVLSDGEELYGGEVNTTNNRMELSGAIAVLENTEGAIHILGDSQYVLNGITKWIHNWRRRNWKTVGGAPVENRDLWEKLGALAENRKIIWEHVKGHSGHHLNERCDQLCALGRQSAI